MSNGGGPRNRLGLALLGLILIAVAGGVSATWVHDGDGTCRAVYKPNLERTGCARKLAPLALVSAVLLAGAVVSWDAAARRSHGPAPVTVAGVTTGVVAVAVVLLAMVALDRQKVSGPFPEPGPPRATVAPSPAPEAPMSGGFTPPTVGRR